MGQAAASSQRRTAALASGLPRRAGRYIEAVVAEDTPRNSAQGVGGDGGGQAQTRLWGRSSGPVQLGRARRCAARGHPGTCSPHAYLTGPKKPALPSPSSPGASGHPGVSSSPVTPAPPPAPGLPGVSAALLPLCPPGGVSRGEPVSGKLVCALRTRVYFAKLSKIQLLGLGNSWDISDETRFASGLGEANIRGFICTRRFVPFPGPTNEHLQVCTWALPFTGSFLKAVKANTCCRPASPQGAKWAGVERVLSRACPRFDLF